MKAQMIRKYFCTKLHGHVSESATSSGTLCSHSPELNDTFILPSPKRNAFAIAASLGTAEVLPSITSYFMPSYRNDNSPRQQIIHKLERRIEEKKKG